MAIVCLLVIGMLVTPLAHAEGYYTKVNVNDAPDGGRFSIEAFMISGFGGAPVTEQDTPLRPLLLRFARSNGENSFLITWDLALRLRDNTRYEEKLHSLGRRPLDGFLSKGEEVWAVWWIPAAWEAEDFDVVYGEHSKGFSRLDEKGLEKAFALMRAANLEQFDFTRVGPQAPEWQPNLAAFDALPVPKDAPAPIYPRSASSFGFRGTVTVAARVDTSGAVTAVHVVHSDAHHSLNLAALKAVSRWTFTPGSKDGIVVEGDVVLPIRFTKSRRK